MKLLHSLAAVLAVLAVVPSARLLANPGSAATRLIAASISVDGEVVLRASTSDDGHPDADEVWGYLNTALVFEPTEAFASLKIAPDANEATLGWLRGKATAHLGAPPKMIVDVAYGGLDQPFVLKLERVEGGWRIAEETVDGRFAYRRITRREAALLDDPERVR